MTSLCALNKNTETCISKPVLKSLAKQYIPESINSSNKIIIEKLSQNSECGKLDTLQQKEICILKNIKKDNKDSELPDMIDKIMLNSFKPITKRLDSKYWINNSEIDNIQHQLQSLFPNYYYTNIHMIDLVMFDPTTKDLMPNIIKPITEINFVDEINKVNNYLTYNKELKYYGMVINTDKSTGRGLHWFSIYIDFTKSPITIEYFNSSGYDIENKNFKKFFLDLADTISFHCKQCKFIKVTDIEHQRSDTANCGSYSLFYIWKRLNNTKLEYFTNNKITDEEMTEFRSFLFRLE